MTKREFMEAIANMLDEADTDEKMNLREYALKEIEKMNDRNKARSSKPTPKQKENEAVKKAILAALIDGEPMISSAIAEKIGQTTQKVSALCRQMVEANELEEMEVKIPKAGKRKAFKIAGDVLTLHVVEGEPIEVVEE